MSCGVKGCGVGLHRTSEHYDGWGEEALKGVILGLTMANKDLLTALKATLALMQEAGEIVVADPSHNVGLAANMELVYRKATLTILKNEEAI